MNPAPVIVALVPTFNAGPFLRPSVDSLVSQSRRPDRIIVIDDASSDGSIDSLADLVASGEVELLRNPENLGKSASLNRCFATITADYFILQDADDISLPHRVRDQLDFMESAPEIGCSSGFVQYISRNGRPFGVGRLDLVNRQRLAEYLAGSDPFGLFCPAVILRGTTVADENLRFRKEFWPADDIDLWNRIAESGWVVLAQPEVLVQYRVHESSAVTSGFLRSRMKYDWLRSCLRARRNGRSEPTWEEFIGQWKSVGIPSRINRTRKIYAKALYRSAGFAAVERRWIAAAIQGATAAVLQPEYVISRLFSQWKGARP